MPGADPKGARPEERRDPAGVGGELLRDIGRLLTRSHDLAETLDNVVRLVARRLRAQCCSVYVVDPRTGELVLRATRGLRPEAVGRVRIPPGRGIVGAAFEADAPIAVADVRRDPRFLPVPETGEARFRSMLAVPLRVRNERIGVLTIQTPRPRRFAPEEIELLELIAAQVASIVLNAMLLDALARQRSGAPPPAEPERIPPGTVLRGLALSPGIAIGPAHVEPPRLDLAAVPYTPSRSRRAELRAVERAFREAVRQLADLREAVGRRLGEPYAEVFSAHILILEDQSLRERVRARVLAHGDGLRALRETLEEYLQRLRASPDPLLRERAADFEDAVERVARELLGVRRKDPGLRDGVVVVAERLSPGDFALLEIEKVAGIVTEHGGPTSHVAIFARGLEIPAVGGVAGIASGLGTGDVVVVDGIEGRVIVEPSPETLAEYREREREFREMRRRLEELRDLPARTRDGVEVALEANIGGLTDLELVRRYGARGIGLFRTEVLALASRTFPSEEEQLRVYAEVAAAMAPDPVTVRVFDLGGDKRLPAQDEEVNPQLGWRSIRLLLDLGDVLDAQLRALVRANRHGNVRILVPMITSVEELEEVQLRYERALRAAPELPRPPLGVMVETPAAVELADALAARVDFFSIGTNDLVQYTLATDRENERVALLYDPFHPGVLRQLARVADAAEAAGIPCAVCGEMAANPAAVPLLLGTGILELSMSPFAVPLVRYLVRSLEARGCRELAARCRGAARGADVRGILHRFFAAAGALDDPFLGPSLRRQLERVAPERTLAAPGAEALPAAAD